MVQLYIAFPGQKYEISSLTFTKSLTCDVESIDTKSKFRDALDQITVVACQDLPSELSEVCMYV